MDNWQSTILAVCVARDKTVDMLTDTKDGEITQSYGQCRNHTRVSMSGKGVPHIGANGSVSFPEWKMFHTV